MPNGLWIYTAIFGFCFNAGISVAVDLKKVVFAGSSTILPLIEDSKDLLKERGFKVQIQGGGSGVGIRSAESEMADIGMVSRDLNPDEIKTLKSKTIAMEPVAIIVHKQNQLSDISSKTVSQIYSGALKQWANGQKIHGIGKESGRATRKVFLKQFNLSSRTLDKSLTIIGANGQAISSVSSDPGAIAYVSVGAAKKAMSQGVGIKILKLNGVEASTENVVSGQYPFSRKLNLVFKQSKEVSATQLLGFVDTREFKDILGKYHMIPVKP